jgi:O-antigen biosynthesis protein
LASNGVTATSPGQTADPTEGSVPHGAVCVLGAPRSGTSLTARALNILGVDLGPEAELMNPAAGNNQRGFWEHQGIADLNEDILATLGDAPRQRWRHPPPLALGWQRDPRLDSHRGRARSILERSFAIRPLWGWKDPRTSLTLPFWEEALPRAEGVESEVRYAICVRHPLEVAASLRERDGMPAEESIELWRRYMSDALTHTEGKPRICIAYESYFPAWEAQAERLASFLGLPGLTGEQRVAIGRHLDEGLRHHRDGGRDERTGGSLSGEIGELYALLTELARS